jgi:hypothetical protein
MTTGEEGDGSIAGPLAGVRVHPRVRAPLSSGFVSAPFVLNPRRGHMFAWPSKGSDELYRRRRHDGRR